MKLRHGNRDDPLKTYAPQEFQGDVYSAEISNCQRLRVSEGSFYRITLLYWKNS